MKIQLLYILDCPWCLETKKLLRQSLEELKVEAEVEEILIDSDEKAKKYQFVGSPTIRINGRDIQEKVHKIGVCPVKSWLNDQEKQRNLSSKNAIVAVEPFSIKVNNILILPRE